MIGAVIKEFNWEQIAIVTLRNEVFLNVGIYFAGFTMLCGLFENSRIYYKYTTLWDEQSPEGVWCTIEIVYFL